MAMELLFNMILPLTIICTRQNFIIGIPHVTKAGNILYVILITLNSRRSSVSFLVCRIPSTSPTVSFRFVTEIARVSTFSARLKGRMRRSTIIT
jgi:hypothetical protein